MDEETLFHGERCRLERGKSASVFRDGRPYYNVSYGDAGWECDPGTEYAQLGEALADIRQAITELIEIQAILESEAA